MGEIIHKNHVWHRFEGIINFKVKIHKGNMKGSTRCIRNIHFASMVNWQGFNGLSNGKIGSDIQASANSDRGIAHHLKYSVFTRSPMILNIYGKLLLNAIYNNELAGQLEIQDFSQNTLMSAKLFLNPGNEELMKHYLNNQPVSLMFEGSSVMNPHLKTVVQYLQLQSVMPARNLKIFCKQL
jgi:hypothetical protein